jgi:hypothetical protein
VWEFIFPDCSIGIYFFSALERTCFSLCTRTYVP